jgi:DNA-binding transcriptional ArsR family regulator
MKDHTALVTQFTHPDSSSLKLEAVLHALGDPVRLAIVKRLAAGPELACFEAVAGLDIAKSTQSHHFRILREAGIIQTRKEGVACLSALRRADLDRQFPGLIDAILANAPAGTRAERQSA